MTMLEGRKALVTGARAGIGAATGRALARAGARVALTGRREGDCAALAAEITAGGGQAFDHALDVADLAGVAGRVDAAAERLGGLDIVVNNAATIGQQAPLGDLDPLAFDACQRTHLSGAAAVIQAAWRHLAGRGGRILNVASGAAVRPMPGWAAYCASKAGLVMLTRQAQLEGEADAILAFAIAPGLVDTAMQGAIREAGVNAVAEIPRDRLDPPEMSAEAIAWLVSGAGDDLAGEMQDIRDPALRARLGWEEST